MTGYNFCENPSILDLTKEQRKFYDISLKLFLSCPASERETVYSSFLQSVNDVIIIDLDEHLPTVARDHCLRSTGSLKPDYVLFKGSTYFPSDKNMHDQIFSVMSDLDAVAMTCYGDVKSLNMFHKLYRDEFFVKKVGHSLVFCSIDPGETTLWSPISTELVRSLISAPKSSLQEPDHVSQNHDVCDSLHLTEKTSDQTLTHSLSYLREIKIWCPTSELVSLLNNLHHVPRLSELGLLDVGMGNQDCQLLATALKYVGKLRLLNLSLNPLGVGISELAKHLHNVPHLKQLDLSLTQMGEEEVTALARSLKNVTQLSELNLKCNPLGHGISELAKHLHNVPDLKKLHLNNTQMGEEEVTALALSLKNVTQLSVLNLSKNPLGHGVSELAKHLHSVPHLEKLRLNNTQMGEEEVTALALSLKNVTQLSLLGLSNNPLGHGVSELVKHLHSVPHLKELYLSNTQMGEEEVKALTRVLIYVPELWRLGLDKNPLGRGVTELIKRLGSSPRVLTVPSVPRVPGVLRFPRVPMVPRIPISPMPPFLGLVGVQLTKKEATELCTLKRKRRIILDSDYLVSCSFVICVNARNTQELAGRRKVTVLQRGCVAILIRAK